MREDKPFSRESGEQDPEFQPIYCGILMRKFMANMFGEDILEDHFLYKSKQLEKSLTDSEDPYPPHEIFNVIDEYDNKLADLVGPNAIIRFAQAEGKEFSEEELAEAKQEALKLLTPR